MIVKYPAFLRTEFRVGAGPRPLFNCFTKSKTLFLPVRFSLQQRAAFWFVNIFSTTWDNYSHSQKVLGRLPFFTSVFFWNLHACSQGSSPTPPLLEYIYLPSKDFYSLFKGLQYSRMHAGIKIAWPKINITFTITLFHKRTKRPRLEVR